MGSQDEAGRRTVDPREGRTADLPPGLAILWRAPEPGRRGPRPGLTLEQIAGAAVALADAEGLAAVSMARLAEALGVTTMALYRYVSGKDDVLSLMYDLAIRHDLASMNGPVTGPAREAGPTASAPPWRAALEVWCRAQLALVRAHPWIVDVATAVPQIGPHRLEWIERALAALDGTPLTHAERAEVTGRLSLHVLSEGRLIAAVDQQRRQAQTGAEQEPPGHPALFDYAAILRQIADADRHPAVTAALEAGAFDAGPDDEHDEQLGLDLMLDGVAALIERARARRM